MAGAGLIGKRHIKAIQDSNLAQVAAVVDPDGTARDFAVLNGLDWYPTIAEMLGAETSGKTHPDGVIIATPNQMHVDNGLACIRAGLPVLIEKPIADASRSAQRLVDQAESAEVPILVGHHRRHNPIIQAARERIVSGVIGEVVAVHAACWLYKPDTYFDVTWRTQEGAGPVFINLIHDIDLLRYLIGEVETVQAAQSCQTRAHAVEDTAAIILSFSNGALATVTVSDTIVSPWSWELTAGENPAYPDTGQTSYFIGGTRGSIEVPTGRVWSQEGERSWWLPIDQKTYQVEHREPLDTQIRHFCDVVNRKAAPLVSGREALKSLQVVEAIKKSAICGARIHVPDLD